MYSRQLDYFISVAEYLSFTKAAQHHFMAQTAMSQQIRVLENKIGVDLFIRNNRSVQLTPAGRIFLQETKRIIAISEEAIKKAQLAASGFVGSLKIGFLGPNEKRFLPDLIKNFRHDYPNIILSFKQGNAETIRSDLEHGLLDIAFTMAFDLDQTPGLVWETLYCDPICVILHRDHPLANETKISPSALAHEPFVAMEHREYPGAVERMIQFCIARGFTPNIVSTNTYLETVLLMVEAGIGVTLLPRFFDSYTNDNIRFIDLAGDPDYVYSVACWKKNYCNPSIPIFLKELGIPVETTTPASTKNKPKER
ncbi:MAG: transcriptional regulator AlsR family [Firmicutes bacterium]|nr:transcriptional regulator AlsR family [Bacillota bacterium]